MIKEFIPYEQALELKEFGKEYVYNPEYKILVFGDHLFVPLPNANNEWTFEAFEFAENFIKKK